MREISFTLRDGSGDWDITIFIEPKTEDLARIGSRLADIGCVDERLQDAVRPIIDRRKNEGFTFTNPVRRATISATINSTSRDEFMNTLAHELRHVERHICEANGIGPYTEGAGYLAGAISEAVYPRIGDMICG